jgi:hypothetical protein
MPDSTDQRKLHNSEKTGKTDIVRVLDLLFANPMYLKHPGHANTYKKAYDALADPNPPNPPLHPLHTDIEKLLRDRLKHLPQDSVDNIQPLIDHINDWDAEAEDKITGGGVVDDADKEILKSWLLSAINDVDGSGNPTDRPVEFFWRWSHNNDRERHVRRNHTAIGGTSITFYSPYQQLVWPNRELLEAGVKVRVGNLNKIQQQPPKS